MNIKYLKDIENKKKNLVSIKAINEKRYIRPEELQQDINTYEIDILDNYNNIIYK